ncbi:MAG TPA: hypothetical protein VII06_43130 [Chloroflexota bacterium]|jgi:hypothetical protein
MPSLKAVTNTGRVRILAGDVCIADALTPNGVQQSSSLGQAGFVGIAVENIAPNGLGHVAVYGRAFVNCPATPPAPAAAPAVASAGCARVRRSSSRACISASYLRWRAMA